MKRVKKFLPGIFSGLASLLFMNIAFAQVNGGGGGSGCPPSNGGLINPLGNTCDISGVLANISSFLLVIAAPICGIMVVVGGFQMLTAAGDPKKFADGQKTLIYAAVGFVVVLFASSVVPLLKSILGG